MVLRMARPHLHPRSGYYWLRKRVPADLVAVVGRKEEVFSLRTRDPNVAKRRFNEEVAKLEARWADLRAKVREQPSSVAANGSPRTLTEREAHERAAWLYRTWLDRYRDNPSQQTFWPTGLYKDLWPSERAPKPSLDSLALIPGNGEPPGWGPAANGATDTSPHPHAKRLAQLRSWCFDEADTLIFVHDWSIDDDSRLRLAKALAAAVQRASLVLARYAQGDYSVDRGGRHQPDRPTGSAPRNTKPVSFDALVSSWAAERRPAPRTVSEWSRIIDEFKAFVRHDDAARVTPDDVVAWKEALIAKGLKPKTIGDAHLTALRTVLQWATDNRRLASNPAERVKIDIKKAPGEAKRGYTDDEAAKILTAALSEANPALRWVPWLCAYSGARVAEICQLRVEDIREVDGIWCMKFDPDAGPLKTASSERAVPLHDAVLESGFLAFVQDVGSGPLFPNLPRDKFGRRGGNGTKVVGRWVRGLGLSDPRIAPNHSWRHRLKTLARRHGLAPDIVDAITGHGKRTVADTYGEFEMSALYRELSKIPKITIID